MREQYLQSLMNQYENIEKEISFLIRRSLGLSIYNSTIKTLKNERKKITKNINLCLGISEPKDEIDIYSEKE